MTNEELFSKAREVGSAEELLKLAHDNGMTDFTEESAKEYFNLIKKNGELSDDELSDAAGGCKKGGRRVVSPGYICVMRIYKPDSTFDLPYWRCDYCHHDYIACGDYYEPTLNEVKTGFVISTVERGSCNTCDWCTYENGLMLCNNPKANLL